MATSKLKKILEAENKKWPNKLKRVNEIDWPDSARAHLIEVWRSRYFLLQMYLEKGGAAMRLSICRSTIGYDGRWQDSITWDELQELKNQCGRGDMTAIEFYPPDEHIVNVANMRHLWLLNEPPAFMWKNE